MKREKDTKDIKPKKWKLIVIILLMFILIASYIVRTTDLIRFYEINYVTGIIVKNTFNILFVVLALSAVFYAEIKISTRREEERKMKNEQHRN